MIIMGTMEGIDEDDDTHNGEEESSSQGTEQEQFSTMEFKEYDGFSEDDPTDVKGEAERTQAMYEWDPPSPSSLEKRESNNEIVYRRQASTQEELVREIPLFEFGGPIPELMVQPIRTLHMAAATELQPEEIEEPKRGLKSFVRVLKDPGM